jgi:DNA polymerase-3 subunit delta
MIIFLYGPDTFRSRQKLKEIVEYYKKIHKSGLNLVFFDLKEKGFQDFLNFFESSSMFGEKKLAVLENASQNKEFQEKFLKKIKDFSDSKNFVLFYEGEIQENDFFKKLKENSRWQNFRMLKGKSLEFWIKKEIKKFGAKIEKKALEKLIEFVGEDLWQMENEIKKLVSFKKEIGQREVELLVKPKIEIDIFKTIDAIAQRNKKRALELVRRHLEKGDSPNFVLAMMNFQFRNLLVIKELIEKGKSKNYILRETELHPFLVEKTLKLAKKFQFEELKKIYQRIFQTDFDIKTGKLTPEVGLEMLILGI